MIDFKKYHRSGMMDSNYVIEIKDTHSDILNKLKPSLSNSECLPIKLEFKREDNEDILLEYGINSYNEIYTSIEFFSKFCIFPKKFIEKYNVEKCNIELIRKLEFNLTPTSISINENKPFGSNNIHMDIAEQLNGFKLDTEWYKENMKMFDNIFIDTIYIFTKAINELNFTGGFEPIDNTHWQISKSYIRKFKINKLFNNGKVFES